LSASGRSWTSWRGIIWNTGYRYIPLYTGSTVSVPPTDGGATRLPDSAGSIQEDIAAELASTVHAAADGKVIYSGRKGGYGYCVMIRHAYGFVTLYGHLSACYVPEGEEVRSGKVIGFIGSSGKSTGNHLHYEVRKYGRPVRPYIRKRRGL
jgi:murein DD-endopeptidase MepM/ murein hydrolase activator NlpD